MPPPSIHPSALGFARLQRPVQADHERHFIKSISALSPGNPEVARSRRTPSQGVRGGGLSTRAGDPLALKLGPSMRRSAAPLTSRSIVGQTPSRNPRDGTPRSIEHPGKSPSRPGSKTRPPVNSLAGRRSQTPTSDQTPQNWINRNQGALLNADCAPCEVLQWDVNSSSVVNR